MTRYAELAAFALASFMMQGELLAFTSDETSRFADGQLPLAQTAPSLTSSAGSPSKLYIVQRGDTLYSIAVRHGLAFEQLAEINGIQPPYIIELGQQLHTTSMLEKQADSAPHETGCESLTAPESRGISEDSIVALEVPPEFLSEPVQQDSDTPSGSSPEASMDEEHSDEILLYGNSTDNGDKRISLVSDLSEEMDAGKKSLTSSVGVKDGFRLRSTYIEKTNGWRSKTLASSNSEWEADVKFPLLHGLLDTSGKFSTGKLNEEDGNGFGDPSQYFIKLNVAGKKDNFGYGTRYHSLGEDYMTLGDKPKGLKNDSEGYKSWLSWKHNKLNLKTSYSENWNNVAENPRESRTTDQLVSLSPGITLHSTPYVGVRVSYGTGTRETAANIDGTKTYQGPLSEISTSFDVSAKKMDFSLTSSLSESKNELIDSDTSTIVSHYISGNYYPFTSLYITPEFSFSQESYKTGTQEYRYTSTSSSLSMTYVVPRHPASLNLYAYHYSYKGNDGYTDSDTLNAKLSMDWKFRSGKKDQSTLTFEISKDDYIDHVYSDSSTSDLFAGVFWRWNGGK